MADWGIVMAVAAVVALVIVAARVRPRDLAGFWLSSDGSMHKIEAAGGALVARGAGPPRRGELRGLRGVRLGGDLQTRGRVGLGRAHIYWDGGETWVRQGVRPTRL